MNWEVLWYPFIRIKKYAKLYKLSWKQAYKPVNKTLGVMSKY